MSENKLKDLSHNENLQSGNTVTRVAEIRESIQISPTMMDDMKLAFSHYLHSKPEEIKQIILEIIKEQFNYIDLQKIVGHSTDNIKEFIKKNTASNPHIKSISCVSRMDNFLVNIIHDYSDSILALDEIEPLLSTIEDTFKNINFDFNVLHISNSNNDSIPILK